MAKAKKIWSLFLTCLADRGGFYERNGYQNQGQSASAYASESWTNTEKQLENIKKDVDKFR